jgi:hypothetical protein
MNVTEVFMIATLIFFTRLAPMLRWLGKHVLRCT